MELWVYTCLYRRCGGTEVYSWYCYYFSSRLLGNIKTLNAAVKFDGPSYIRLTGTSNNPIVYNKDYDFEIGKAIKLVDGDDVAIISTGSSRSSFVRSC